MAVLCRWHAERPDLEPMQVVESAAVLRLAPHALRAMVKGLLPLLQCEYARLCLSTCLST